MCDRDTRDVSLWISSDWLEQPDNEDVARWLEASGYEDRREGGLSLVHISAADWTRLGTPPYRGIDPESVDAWLHAHDALARLAGVERQALLVQSIGHVGAEAFSVELRVDGARLDLSSDLIAPTIPLLPVTHALAERCRTFLKGTRTRASQLAFVGELQDYASRINEIFAASRAPISLTMDDHLASHRFERVDRAALTWRTSGKAGGVYGLGVEYTRADGSIADLPPAAVDPDAPIASMSGREHLLLAEDVAVVARAAKGQRNKVRRHVAEALTDPKRVLPAGHAYENIDFSRYSPRVAGFVAVVRADRPADVRSSGVQWYSKDHDPSIPFLRIDIAQPDGEQATLTFDSPDAARAFVAKADASTETDVIRHGDIDVIPTKPLVDRVREDLALYDRLDPGGDADSSEDAAGEEALVEQATRYAAVIKDAETAAPLDTAGPEIDDSAVPWSTLETLFAPGTRLKEHQRQGIAWLWHHYQSGRHGVLLADDMGLGKTLQIAAFLALLRHAGRETDRTKPSLIVAPVILLENWRRETKKFFRDQVFESLFVLYDRGLRSRVDNGRLDVTGLSEYAVVLTNYDTLARYQQHLLTVDFAAAVLDEAQAVKNPDALRTLAARGLKRTFAICATGTPVENRLLDLWSLYDVLSPGRPFASRSRFQSEYEDQPDAVAKLRAALALPSLRSTLLRRTKAEALTSLPTKHEHVHPVAMTSEQLAQERMITRMPSGRRVLEILHQLQKLYQHPRLLLRAEEAEVRAWSPREIVAQSPKLAKVIDLLREIRERSEKALVFTLWTAMQDLLARVIESELGIERVRIINGDTNQQGRAQKYLDELEAKRGFDVLILSPLAAGTGLTITAANHVIHYGRWWNPAKEDQATDRAYRIGQTRDVHVHYPVLHHPGRPDAGFDMKLHELVNRKRSMARDFLDPSNVQEISEADLVKTFSEEQ